MKANVFRVIFIVLLVSSLALRQRAIFNRSEAVSGIDMISAISQLVQANQVQLLENPGRQSKFLENLVYFAKPGCSEPSIVMPFALHFDPMMMYTRAIKPGYSHRFYYLDKEWPEQDRVAMHITWLKVSGLAIFDATPFLPVNMAIMVAEPEHCSGASPIDWRLLWDRKQLEKMQFSRKASAAHSLVINADHYG